MYKYRKSKEWLKAQRKRTNVDLSSRRKLEIRRNDEFEQTISRWTVPRTLFRWIYRSFQVFIWFQDEYRNISFIPSYRKLRLDSTGERTFPYNGFVVRATRTFQRICWKKTKKEKKEEKQVLKVYEKYQATSELWSWENADALVHQPLFFSPLSILYEIYGSGISKD